MFLPEPRVQIWLCNSPVDMRKSYDGLSAWVQNQMDLDPLSGQLFVFINKRKTHMKVLYFESSGYCIWSKRLEQGQFNHGHCVVGKTQLNFAKLKLLLDGVMIQKSRQYKRYCHHC